MKIEEYTRLKSKIEQLRQRRARAEGALEQAEKRLEEELGIPTSEADGRIAEMKKRTGELRRRVERRLEVFAEKWGQKLEEVR